MKLKAKRKERFLVVKVKLTNRETYDAKQLDRFSRVELRGFLKLKFSKRNQFEYSGPTGISLSERFERPITRYEFFFIMEQIVIAIQKIRANDLALQHILWDIRYVFINEVTKELQFVYLPLTEPSSTSNVISLIESIVYSVRPVEEELQDEYISKFIHFFKNQQGFDEANLERYIAREDKNVVSIIRKNNVGQSGFMTDKPGIYYEHYNSNGVQSDNLQSNELDDEERTGLLQEEATGLMSDDEATGLLIEEEIEETGLLFEDDETTQLDENRVCEENVHYPVLFRISTEEEIKINKPVFRIGKERSYVDYFVSNNNVVSRSHADFIIRDDRIYIKDLNSKNRTYINDELIQAEVEIEVHDGDRLRFANEEFVLHF